MWSFCTHPSCGRPTWTKLSVSHCFGSNFTVGVGMHNGGMCVCVCEWIGERERNEKKSSNYSLASIYKIVDWLLKVIIYQKIYLLFHITSMRGSAAANKCHLRDLMQQCNAVTSCPQTALCSISHSIHQHWHSVQHVSHTGISINWPYSFWLNWDSPSHWSIVIGWVTITKTSICFEPIACAITVFPDLTFFHLRWGNIWNCSDL